MPTREVLSVCYYSKCCEMFRAVEVIQTGGKWWESAVCSAVVESWYKRQYTCLVVKRRTAAVSPATSTIIATVCLVLAQSLCSPRGERELQTESVDYTWSPQRVYLCLHQ